VWDAVFGMDGHKAAFPNGHPPKALPRLRTTPVVTDSATVSGGGARNGALPDLAWPPALAVRFGGRPTLAGNS
jgi:hypothetical protein